MLRNLAERLLRRSIKQTHASEIGAALTIEERRQLDRVIHEAVVDISWGATPPRVAGYDQ